MIRHIGSFDAAWDFIGCSLETLMSVDKKILDTDVRDSDFGIIDSLFYRFPGGGEGISYLAVIQESHIAIHTSPENKGIAEITIHTCAIEGTGAINSPEEKTKRLYDIWVKRFSPNNIHAFQTRLRGKTHE